MLAYSSPTLETRLWSYADKTDTCWLWKKGRNRGGYPLVHAGGVGSELAHRIAWTLTHGPIPSGLKVCHTCDVRHCINPAHLFLGTQRDNMRDCKQKGRWPVRPRGGDNHKAKVSEADVRAIRCVYAAKLKTQAEIAGDYGVTQAVVSKIVRRDTWKHLV